MALTRLPRRKRGARIDLSLAIVNIVLLLILFFLIAGQLLTGQRLRADPARTEALALGQLPSPVLAQDPSGQWQLDGVAVSLEDLSSRLDAAQDLYLVMDRTALARDALELTLRPDLSHLTIHLVTVRQGPAP